MSPHAVTHPTAGSRSALLGARYEFDGHPHLRLNALQLEVKAQLERKLAAGVYRTERVPCVLCGGSSFEPLAAKDRYGLQLSVVICGECALVQTNPRMDERSYAEFYNDEYRPLYGGEPEPTEDFFGAQYLAGARVHAYVTRHGMLRPPRGRVPMVLEIGCGAGGILQYFRDQGCRVMGLDLGEAYVEYGRRRHGLDLRAGTLADVPADVRPDLVIYSHVVEHLPDPIGEMRRVRERLADGAGLYVEVPGLRSLWRFYRMDLLRYLQNAHTYHFSAVTLRWLLEAAGFSAVAVDERVRSVFRPTGDGDAAAVRRFPPRDPAAARAEHERTIGYLRRAESLRRISPAHPFELKERARSAVFGALDAVGILPLVRRLRGRS